MKKIATAAGIFLALVSVGQAANFDPRTGQYDPALSDRDVQIIQQQLRYERAQLGVTGSAVTTHGSANYEAYPNPANAAAAKADAQRYILSVE